MARPKEFDRDTALQKAMNIFWSKGYEGTSILDLTEAMGISRSSLYETFGDKQDLFLEALNHYLELVDRKRAAVLTNAASVKQGMATVLQEVIKFTLDADYPGGCFFTNTATALGTLDEHVQTLIKVGSKKWEDDFYDFLDRGQQRGEISPDRDIRALARFFVGLVRGITVLARIQRNPDVLEDIAKTGLEVLE